MPMVACIYPTTSCSKTLLSLNGAWKLSCKCPSQSFFRRIPFIYFVRCLRAWIVFSVSVMYTLACSVEVVSILQKLCLLTKPGAVPRWGIETRTCGPLLRSACKWEMTQLRTRVKSIQEMGEDSGPWSVTGLTKTNNISIINVWREWEQK